MVDLLTDLRAILETTPTRWRTLTAHVSEDLLRRQPKQSEWSALECLQHLIDLDRGVFPQRVRALLAGQNFPAFFPDADGTPLASDVSPATMVTEFENLRKRNLKLLNEITPEDLDREGIHAELGPVTLKHLLHEWAGHDLMHIIQAEQALMQPFIEGCGPWRVYFLKHVVE